MQNTKIEGQLQITTLARKESDYYALRFLADNPSEAERFSGEIRREREQMAALLRDFGMENPEVFMNEASLPQGGHRRRTLTGDQADRFLALVRDQKLAFGQ